MQSRGLRLMEEINVYGLVQLCMIQLRFYIFLFFSAAPGVGMGVIWISGLFLNKCYA